MLDVNTTRFDLVSTADNLEHLLTALTGLANFHNVDPSIQSVIALLVEQSENLSCIVSLSKSIPREAIQMGLMKSLPLVVDSNFKSDFEH